MTMIEQISKLVKENQLLVGLFGAVGFGTIIGIFYKVYGLLMKAFNHFCFVNMSFESIDFHNFKKVQFWLYNLPYTKKRCRSFNVRYVQKSKYGSNNVEDEQLFYPGYGKHYLMLNNRPSIIFYNKSDSKELAFRETIEISIFCLFRKSSVTEKLLEQINHNYDSVEYTSTSIHACIDDFGGWTELLSKNIKQHPILSYEEEYTELVEDIQNFINNEEWYSKRGIAHKRGFLFTGVPGSGKTSCILTLAQRFKKHVNILNLTSTIIDDAKFIELVTSLDKDSILAIEDIDGIYADRSKDMDNGKQINTVTLSTILNTLDGMFSPEGLIFFLTTNCPEKLDPALIRPGRIAVRKDFKNSNAYQAKTIFTRFFPEAEERHIKRFEKGVGKSMAYLENHLMNYPYDIEKACEIE